MNNTYKIFLCFNTSKYNDFSNRLLKLTQGKYNVNFFNIANISDDFDVNSMNLIVFVIDNDFFFNDDLLKYTKITNIPILPIAIGNIDDFLYQQVFRELHYFKMDINNISNKDEISISLYLEALLLDKKTIKKIKDSFYESIFISYRKKDKEFAKKLIKKIRLNKDSYSIALWFDEYLMPGEDFNDEIKDEIEDSSLFCMVVSPNLINEDNYVQKIEYPLAKELNKKIFSVEFELVDKQKLSEKYQGVLDTLLDSNVNDIFNVIKDCFSRALNATSSPIDYYYLGLAFLKGIYTEKNEEIGIEYLVKAGNGGVIDSYKELYKYYYFGQEDGFNVIKYKEYYEKYWYSKAKKIIDDNDIDTLFNDIYALAEQKYFIDPGVILNYLAECKLILSKNEYDCLLAFFKISVMDEYPTIEKLNLLINSCDNTNLKLKDIIDLFKVIVFLLENSDLLNNGDYYSNYFLIKKHLNDDSSMKTKLILFELLYDNCYNGTKDVSYNSSPEFVKNIESIILDFEKTIEDFTIVEKDDYSKKISRIKHEFDMSVKDPFSELLNCNLASDSEFFVGRIVEQINFGNEELDRFYSLVDEIMNYPIEKQKIYSFALYHYYEFNKRNYLKKKYNKEFCSTVLKQIEIINGYLVDNNDYNKIETINYELGKLYYQLALKSLNDKNHKDDIKSYLEKGLSCFNSGGYVRYLNLILKGYMYLHYLTKEDFYAEKIKKVVNDIVSLNRIYELSKEDKKYIKKVLHIKL